MASYLTVKLKRKGESYKLAPVMVELTTTPARELARNVNLVYGDGVTLADMDKPETKAKDNTEYGWYTILTDDVLDEIIAFYKGEIDDYKESIDRHMADKEDLRQALSSAEQKAAFSMIMEEIHETNQLITWALEAVDEYDMYYQWFIVVKRILSENYNYSTKTNDYELIYYYD